MNNKEKIKFSKLRLRNNASRSKKGCSPHPREQISSYFPQISTQNETAIEEPNTNVFALNTQLLEDSPVLKECEKTTASNIISGTPTDGTSFNKLGLSQFSPMKCKPRNSNNSTADDETDFELSKTNKSTKIFEILKPKKSSRRKIQNKKNMQIGKSKFDPSTSDTNNEHLQLAIALSKSLDVFENPEINNSSQTTQQKSFKQTLDEFGFKSDKTASSFVTARSNARLQNRKRFKHLTPVLYLRTEEDRANIIQEKVSLILTDNNKKGSIDKLNSRVVNNKPRSFLLRDYYNQNATLFNKNSLSLSQMEAATFYNSTVSPSAVKTCVLLKDWNSIPGREKTPPCIKSAESKITDTTTPDLELISENDNKTKKLNVSNDSNKSDNTNKVTKYRLSISPDLFSDNEIENYEDTPSNSSKNIDAIISSFSTIDKNLESDTSLKSVSILDSISPKRLKLKSARNTSVLCRRNIFQNEENKILQDDESLSSFTDIETDSLTTYKKIKSTFKKAIQNTKKFNEDSLSPFEHESPKKAKSKSPKKGKSPKKTEKTQFFKNNLLTGDASLVLINAANSSKKKSVSSAKKSLNFIHVETFKNNSSSSEDPETIIAEHSPIMHYESFCDDNMPCFDLTVSSDDSHDFGVLNQHSSNEKYKKSKYNENIISNKNLSDKADVKYLNDNNSDFPDLIVSDLDKKNNASVVDIFKNAFPSPKENLGNDVTNSNHSAENERKLNQILKDSSKEENFDETNDLPDTEAWLNECDKKYSSKEKIIEKCKENIQKNDCVIVLSEDSKDSQASVETVKLNLNNDISIISSIRPLENNIRDRTLNSSTEDEDNQNISKVKHYDFDFTNTRICSTSQVKKRESKIRFSKSFSENMIGEYQYTSSPISRRKSISFGSNKNISILNNQTPVAGIVNVNHLLAADEEADNLLYVKSNDAMLFLSQSSIGTASDISDDELNYSCNVSLQKRRLCEEMDLEDADEKTDVEIPCINDLSTSFFEPQRDKSLNAEKPNITLLQTQKIQSTSYIYREESESNITLPKFLEDRQCKIHRNPEDTRNISTARVLDSEVENQVSIVQIKKLPACFFEKQHKLNYDLKENETINSSHILKPTPIKELNVSKINSTSQLLCINNSFNEILDENVEHVHVEDDRFSEINLPNAKNNIVENLYNICTPISSKSIIKTKNITPRGNLSDMDTPNTHKELARYGVKPMKRSKGIKLLKYIYDATHPISEQFEKKISSNSSDSEDDRINKRRKTQQSPTFKSPEIEDNICNNNDIEIIGSDIAESENLKDMIFERTQSSKIRSCRIPFHIVWHNFVSDAKELQEKILLYEPLQVEDLYARIKHLGFKFHMQDIISFLDKKCITIKIGQATRVPKRTVSKLNST